MMQHTRPRVARISFEIRPNLYRGQQTTWTTGDTTITTTSEEARIPGNTASDTITTITTKPAPAPDIAQQICLRLCPPPRLRCHAAPVSQNPEHERRTHTYEHTEGTVPKSCGYLPCSSQPVGRYYVANLIPPTPGSCLIHGAPSFFSSNVTFCLSSSEKFQKNFFRNMLLSVLQLGTLNPALEKWRAQTGGKPMYVALLAREILVT